MFESSKDISIHGGVFVSVSNKTQERRGFNSWLHNIVPGAFYNSAERCDSPKCHPRTRVAIREAIMAWIKDDKETFIMWLFGPAGAGKSAIAEMIAEICSELEILAASFFWARSVAGRNDEKRLITSLAYQLILSIPQIRIYVEEVLEKDPCILDRSLEVQMKALIIKPLEKAFPSTQEETGMPKHRQVIILDGLDECGTPNVQQYILQVISSAKERFAIPIIFLIASRPEQQFRDSFDSEPLLSITRRLALDDEYKPDEDIRLFLVESFDSLKKNHPLGSELPPSWPSPKDLDTLIQKSSGQFIYAATVVKFIRSPRRWPDEQLNIILGLVTAVSDTPFAEIDTLYHHIFSSIEDFPRAREILHFLFIPDVRWHISDAIFIEHLCSYKRGDVQLILIDLHSVLGVPSDLRFDGSRIRVLHASLQDFFIDPHRCGDLYVEEGEIQARIAQHCLRTLREPDAETKEPGLSVQAYSLEFLSEHTSKAHPNKTLLEDFSAFSLEKWVSTLFTRRFYQQDDWKTGIFQLCDWFRKQEPTAKKHFRATLNRSHSKQSDAISFFSDLARKKIDTLVKGMEREHMRSVSLSEQDLAESLRKKEMRERDRLASQRDLKIDHIRSDRPDHFSLSPERSQTPKLSPPSSMVARPHASSAGSSSKMVRQLARRSTPAGAANAHRSGGGPASASRAGVGSRNSLKHIQPQQIGLSAGVGAGEGREANLSFLDDLDIQSVLPGKNNGSDWVAMLNPNPKMRRMLAVNLVHTFRHDSPVCCVRFSPDGKFLATGCNRKVQIYDMKTGVKVCVLADSARKLGDMYIRSMCFSPNGKFLATSSEDKVIRIWDIAMNRIRNTLEGHQQEIYSLDFSLDGRFIVSGSGDKTVRIWDMHDPTSKVLTINDPDLPNDDTGVTSVAISPNGLYVAAGSLDAVVRIWDMVSGVLVERLRGHRDSVYAVAFTPDGKGLVSGSLDKTLKYWDVSGLGVMKSRKDGAGAAASPTPSTSAKKEGESALALIPTKPGSGPFSRSGSGSSACTMNFTGHTDYVLCVTVSHDGAWVVSGSKDRNVQFWDTHTAAVQCMLQGHRNSVISIDLSPAGNLLATGSGDCDTRIWSYNTIA